MTTKMIDGHEYVDSRQAAAMLDNLIGVPNIPQLAHNSGWARQKIGRRWYYRKCDVRLPDYKSAKWQRIVMEFMLGMAEVKGRAAELDFLKSAYESDSYYEAIKALKECGYDNLIHGWADNPKGEGKLYYAFGHWEEVPLIVTTDNLLIKGVVIDRNLGKEQKTPMGETEFVWLFNELVLAVWEAEGLEDFNKRLDVLMSRN